jgi:hypothetical protein
VVGFDARWSPWPVASRAWFNCCRANPGRGDYSVKDTSGSGPRNVANRLLLLLSLGAIAMGLWARFKGLGQASLAVDEYYLTTSARNILQHGLPRLECGGYYTRGLLQQYVIAGLLLIDGSDELLARLVSVAASVAGLPAIYLVARRLFDREVALAALALLALSLWEIEFARFVRMYAPFATLVIWAVYFCTRAIFDQHDRSVNYLWLLGALSIVVYEGAIFIVLLGFLPAIFRSRYRRLPHWVTPSALAVASVAFFTTDFRRWNAEPPPGLETAFSGSWPVDLPAAPLFAAINNPAALILGVLVWAAAIYFAIGWFRAAANQSLPVESRLAAVLFGLCLLLASAGLVGLGLVLFAGALLYCRATPAAEFPVATNRQWLGSALIFPLSALLWGSISLQTGSAAPSVTGFLKAAARFVVDFPDIYRKVWWEWFAVMPVQTLSMSGLSALAVTLCLLGPRKRMRELAWLAFVTVGFLTLTAVLSQPYYSTRYSFFVYPFVLLLSVYCLREIACWCGRQYASIVFIGLVAAFIFGGEDFEWRHLVGVDDYDFLYRVSVTEAQEDHFYPRMDSRAAAEFVNTHAAPGDRVISAVYAVPYYLDRLDYMYVERDSGMIYWAVASCRGEREIWEGAPLLDSWPMLESVLAEGERTSWVIVRTPRYRYRSQGEILITDLPGAKTMFVTDEGQLQVIRVEANPDWSSELATQMTGCPRLVLQQATARRLGCQSRFPA